jgi:hypothetical protein
MAGYTLAPRTLDTAGAVKENAARIMSLREESRKPRPAPSKPLKTATVSPPIQAPQPPQKFPEPTVAVFGSVALEILIIINALAAQFGVNRAEILEAVGDNSASAARRFSAALCVRRFGIMRQDVCAAFGIVDENLIEGLRVLDPILALHQISKFSPLPVVAELIHREWLNISTRGVSYQIGDIQSEICRAFNISRQDMISSRRTWDLVRPRQLAEALSKHLTLRSLPEIGRRFGHRDHTTVLHSCRRMQPAIALAANELPPGSPISAWVEVAIKHARALGLTEISAPRG